MIYEKVSSPYSRESVLKKITETQDPIGYLKEAADQGFSLPRNIIIIPDGNGRWAKRNRRQAISEGHEKGSLVIEQLFRSAIHLFPHIDSITVWGLSPNNMKNRSSDEILGIMSIISSATIHMRDELLTHNARFIHLGDFEGLSKDLQQTLKETEAITQNNTGLKVILAVNYGGDTEQLHVANKAIAYSKTQSAAKLDMQTFRRLRDPYQIGDTDLIIRTGCETEDGFSLSGLGLERDGTQLVFTPTLFPNFTEREFATHLALHLPRRLGGRPNDKR